MKKWVEPFVVSLLTIIWWVGVFYMDRLMVKSGGCNTDCQGSFAFGAVFGFMLFLGASFSVIGFFVDIYRKKTICKWKVQEWGKIDDYGTECGHSHKATEKELIEPCPYCGRKIEMEEL